MKKTELRRIRTKKRFAKDGMTRVDAYLIPNSDVALYIKRRNFYKDMTIEFLKKYASDVGVDFKGSEDGEAVVARDDTGEIIALIHLDPIGIDMMEKAHKDGEFEKVMKKCCFS